MKRSLLWIGGIAALGMGSFMFVPAVKHAVTGAIARSGIIALVQTIGNPIAANHPVTWAQGPSVALLDPKRPPNVILIVADDLGYNDISFNGGGVAGGIVKTPNIDALAQQGVDFSSGYAANATCSPSRAALMTGRYPTRFGFEFTAVVPSFAESVGHAGGNSPVPLIFHDELNHNLLPYPEQGVPGSEITIAEALKGRGYHTVHLGKWHMGEASDVAPNAQGFDETLGFMAGASKFMHQTDAAVVNAKLPWDPIDGYLWPNLPYAVQYNGGQRFEPVGHMTDYLTDNALQAIEANRNRPFFLYLAYNAPHTPLQATKADYDALPQIKDHKTRVYGAMIRQLDRRIGDVMAKLKTLGLDNNTLVIFTSDNGGAWYTGIPDLNKPFRGWKATFFEGGIRVPLFMRWPGRILPGSKSALPVSGIDMFATIAAVTGAAIPTDRPMDSVDVLAGFASSLPPTKRVAPLFWRSGDYRVIRDGDWKLQVTKRPERAYLYNLASDPTEQIDLAARNPAQVTRLRAILEAQNRGMAKPLWPGLIEAPVRVDVPLNAPYAKGQEFVYWTN
ncbi:MAG: sulfatase-like hydrolase/transferase [Sphingomonadaceae bacterium]